MGKEDIELAEEHVKLAEDIVLEETKKSKNSRKSGKFKNLRKEKEFKEAAFALEKAESEIKDLEELEDSTE